MAVAFYYYKDPEDQLVGPLTEVQVLDLRDAGQLQDETPICLAETETWKPLAELNLQRSPAQASRGFMTLLLPSLCFVAAAVFTYHLFHEYNLAAAKKSLSDNEPKPSPGYPAVYFPPPDFVPNSPLPIAEKWNRVQAARQAALHANPDLAAESRELDKEQTVMDDKFNAAMVKIDPKVAPGVAKLVQSQMANQAPGTLDSFTKEEEQELESARAATLRARPDLVAEEEQLLIKVRNFELKLDDAALEADPSIKPFIIEIETMIMKMVIPPSSKLRP